MEVAEVRDALVNDSAVTKKFLDLVILSAAKNLGSYSDQRPFAAAVACAQGDTTKALPYRVRQGVNALFGPKLAKLR